MYKTKKITLRFTKRRNEKSLLGKFYRIICGVFINGKNNKHCGITVFRGERNNLDIFLFSFIRNDSVSPRKLLLRRKRILNLLQLLSKNCHPSPSEGERRCSSS